MCYCPHCKSQKLYTIRVGTTSGVWDATTNNMISIIKAMVYCNNCHRIFKWDDIKWKTDKKRIKRHIIQLQRLLKKES